MFYTLSTGDITWSVNHWQGGIGNALPAQSTQYISVAVTATYTDGSTFDPTSDLVNFAFIGPYATTSQAADYPPTSSTVWNSGSWDTNLASTAHILLGPGNSALTLSPGAYQVWLQILDDPEQPVLWCGPMVVS